MTPDERERLDLYKTIIQKESDIMTKTSERDHYEEAIRKCELAQHQAKLIMYVLLALAVVGAYTIYRLW